MGKFDSQEKQTKKEIVQTNRVSFIKDDDFVRWTWETSEM
jgi:hypothetical protein